jgi:hypothetical protein
MNLQKLIISKYSASCQSSIRLLELLADTLIPGPQRIQRFSPTDLVFPGLFPNP